MNRGWQVFAVDPGETTGWAWACVAASEVARDYQCGGMRLALRQGRVQWGQVPLPGGDVPMWKQEHAVATRLLEIAGKLEAHGSRLSGGKVPEISTWLIEDFILRERTKDRNLLSPVRLTTAFTTLIAESEHPCQELILQSASEAKSTATDERLKRWGFWAKGEQHARDALRHLLTYMRERPS